MKIAIIGAGGVGGYYGGLLARHGHDVTFVARGAHLEAIRKNGLQIKSIFGDFVVSPAQATDNPAEVGRMYLILFCVKAYSTTEAAQAIRPLVGAQTAVISLQNGVEAVEQLGKVIGVEHVLGGMTQISSAIAAPGVIEQVSQFRRIVFGELDGSISARTRAIEEAFKETGVTVEVSQNIHKPLWEKLLLISVASGLGALTGLPMGDWRKPPETRDLCARLMREVESVAGAHGAALDADIVDRTLAFIDAASPTMKASMQLDVAAGRQFELDAIVGAVGRKGREKGVPTPVADMIYACLLPVNLKALGA